MESNDKKVIRRTELQNKALHLYFKLIAEALNTAGLDMRKVLKPEVDIPWSTETVKEYLWRPIQKLQLGKVSTTKLTTKDINLVYDTLNRHLGEKFGIQEDFPSIQTIMYKKYGYAPSKPKIKATD